LARFVPGEWRAFASFLAGPELPERMTGIRFAALGRTLQLFGLDLLLMALLVGIAELALLLGFRIPENAVDKLALNPQNLAIIVLFAPILEELVVRSWVSGRPGHVAAWATLLIGFAVLAVSGMQAHPILLLGDLLIVAVVASGLLFWLRGRPPFAFFKRHFAWFYFASALIFAGAHLLNYGQGWSLSTLPLLLPQLLAGLIFGYTRVTKGIWSDMLLHMMHNGLLISLVVLQKGM